MDRGEDYPVYQTADGETRLDVPHGERQRVADMTDGRVVQFDQTECEPSYK